MPQHMNAGGLKMQGPNLELCKPQSPRVRMAGKWAAEAPTEAKFTPGPGAYPTYGGVGQKPCPLQQLGFQHALQRFASARVQRRQIALWPKARLESSAGGGHSKSERAISTAIAAIGGLLRGARAVPIQKNGTRCPVSH